MQQIWGDLLDDAFAGSALTDFAVTIARMVDAYGTSWNAIVVTLDDWGYGQAKSIVIPGGAIIAVFVAIAMIAVMPSLIRRARIAMNNHRERQAIFDVCEELGEDRRRLQKELSRRLSDDRGSLRGSIIADEKTVAEQGISIIADHRSEDHHRIIDHRRDEVHRTDSRDARIAGAKRKTTQFIAQKSDDRPEATDATVAQWTKERIVTRPGYEIGASSLYQDYCAWCDGNGIRALKQKRFGDRLSDLGMERQTRRTVWYQNVALKSGQIVDLKVVK